MRIPRTLVACALFLAIATLAACGGSGSSASATSSLGGSSSGGQQSNQATQSAAASQGSGGGGGGDLNALADALKPPNANQISRTDAGGGVYIAWESTDSADSLKSFYEKAIPDSGMQVVTTTSAQGTFSWIFAKSAGSTYGGSVTVGPSTSGGSGSSVILAATTE